MTPGRLLRAGGSLLVLLSCRPLAEPASDAPYQGTLAVVPELPAAARAAFAGLVVDAVRVTLMRGDAVVLDTTAAFPVDAPELTLRLQVPLQARSERMLLAVALAGAGVPLFAGSATVDVVAAGTGAPARPTVPLQYVGPGAGVRSLRIAPRDTLVSPGASLPLDVAATDQSGTPVPQFYVSWSSSDPAVTVSGDGVLTAPADRASALVTATTPNGVSDAVRISVGPPPASLGIVRGDGQSGPAGEPLPEPLVVTVRAADGLGVPGVKVRFRALTGGAQPLDATVTTDVVGEAAIDVTLPTVAGPAAFEAGVASLAGSVVFNTTVLAGPPARALSLSGAGQVGVAGSIAGTPLELLVLDRYDNPVPGAAVDWSVVAGQGSMQPVSSVTDAAGVAGSSLRLGPAPLAALVSAAVRASTVSSGFAGLATAGPPAAVVGLVGDGPVSGRGTEMLIGQIVDALGNPVDGAPVAWQILAGSTALSGVSTVSGPGGLAAAAALSPVPPVTIRLTDLQSGAFHDFRLTSTTATLALNLVGGIDQSAVAGEPLPLPVVVSAADPNGTPIPGVTINWQSVAGGGTMAPNPGVTGSGGAVPFTYTAGPIAGHQVVRGSTGVPGAVIIAEWSAAPAAPAHLVAFSGEHQSVPVGSFAPDELVVLLTDGFGNPIPDALVSWTGLGGVPGAASSFTDGQGLARTSVRVTQPGRVEVRASEPTSGLTAVLVITGQ